MKHILSLPTFPAASSALLAIFVALGGTAGAQEVDLKRIWDDPSFQKQFLGGYGVVADVEPRIGPEELKVLEAVRPLMGTDLPNATAELRKAILPDRSAILDFTLGSLYFQQDDFRAAQEAFERAVAKFPSYRRAWRNLGLIHVRDGDHELAIRAFTRMIELGGADAYSFGLLGFAHAARQDYQPAEAAYRNALLLQPENSEWRLGLTRCVFRQGKFEDAVALLDALILRHPEKSEFWLLQAHTQLGRKQPLRAAENLEVIDRMGRSTIDSLSTLGDIYVSEALPDLALSAYRRAIDVDPNQSPARSVRAAEVLASRGATDQARDLAAHVRTALAATLADAERAKLLKLEARISLSAGTAGEEAAAVLQEVIRIDPLDGEALLLLGQHYVRTNRPDEAILQFERAASIDAHERNARIRHAQVLVSQARYTEALPLLRRAQEITGREDVARYIEQIERLARAKR
jgi:tetratricopeptide (TPR) repeat protein